MPQSSQSPRRQVPLEEVSETSSSESEGDGPHLEGEDWAEREDAYYRALDKANEDEEVREVKRKGWLKDAWILSRIAGIYVASLLFLAFLFLLVVSLGAYYFTPHGWLEEEQIEFIHVAFGKFTLVFAAFIFGVKSRDFLSLVKDMFSE